MDNTLTSIETALRFACKDDDGRLYSPITDDPARPHVYLPGHGIFAAGEEIHLIHVYPRSQTIEVLAGDGYTVTEGPLIDLLDTHVFGA